MTRFDVFNGDADGICALHQLRLTQPVQATLITGTKRENRLLPLIDAGAGDTVTALDIAMPGNRQALEQMLARGAHVRYIDHHEPGDIPTHPNLDALIDTDPQVCTSVLVDRLLDGAARRWAIVGAYGDNMRQAATRLADALQLDEATRARWRELGECLNYNAYGVTLQDLLYPPEQLYRAVSPFADPDEFIAKQPHFERLSTARAADLLQAEHAPVRTCASGARIYQLDDANWARRVFGSFANHRANIEPTLVHAVIAPRSGTGSVTPEQNPEAASEQNRCYVVSVRVPHGAAVSAHTLCTRFGGGGRARAAGIDYLGADQLDAFADALARAYPQPCKTEPTP